MPENRSDKVSVVTEWVREELEKNADPSYREFHRSLVPGLENFLGWASVCQSSGRSAEKLPEKTTGVLPERRTERRMKSL